MTIDGQLLGGLRHLFRRPSLQSKLAAPTIEVLQHVPAGAADRRLDCSFAIRHRERGQRELVTAIGLPTFRHLPLRGTWRCHRWSGSIRLLRRHSFWRGGGQEIDQSDLLARDLKLLDLGVFRLLFRLQIGCGLLWNSKLFAPQVDDHQRHPVDRPVSRQRQARDRQRQVFPVRLHLQCHEAHATRIVVFLLGPTFRQGPLRRQGGILAELQRLNQSQEFGHLFGNRVLRPSHLEDPHRPSLRGNRSQHPLAHSQTMTGRPHWRTRRFGSFGRPLYGRHFLHGVAADLVLLLAAGEQAQ